MVPPVDETANNVVLSEGFTTSIYLLTRCARVFSCVFVTLPCGVLGSGVVLDCIAPDRCLLTYFGRHRYMYRMTLKFGYVC